MSVSLSLTTYGVTINTAKQPTYKTKETVFGDGYRQITLDGINYEQEQWNVEFAPMNNTKATTLEGLLQNSVNGTSNYLSVTMPNESTAKYYTAYNIQKVMLAPNLSQISCTFRREFPLS